jgi:hypothetical protein
MELAADELVRQFEENAHPDWQWFEEILTYDNAILPYALFLAGEHLSDKYYEVAEKSCEFLLSKTFNGSHFSFVGSDGWYERGGTKAQFDQQPIEALSTILMLKGAYEAKGKAEYLWYMKKAFNWFLGENDLHIPVYNFTTQGCHDGLMQVGVNTNQGAESMLSFLLSLLTIIENYTLFEKIRESQESPQKSGPTTQIVTKEEQKIAQTGSGQEQQRIKDIPMPDSNTNKNEVAESKQIN